MQTLKPCFADVLNRTGWVVSASVGSYPGNAIDGDITTRWTTGVSQAPGQWFQVDMGGGTPPTFTNLVLDAGSSTGDYPRGYQVNVSNDGTNWSSPVATGAGSSAVTSISFAARTARYIRITQTGSNGLWWSIHELNVDGIGAPPPPAGVTETLGTGQATINWEASPGATSYNVKRSTTYGGPYTVLASNLTGLIYVDNRTVSGTLYFYVISANNPYGESADSVQAKLGWRVVIPSLNTNEMVVAATTPQEYGAKGDGITDDSAAFQAAMNAVYNSGGSGGGVVFVPAGHYAFYTNLNIPVGVTLHGDWQDWSRNGNGMVGTTFKVYYGAGQTTNTPFIFLNSSTALKGVNIWYPNQNANHIVAYPYSIGLSSDSMLQNVALVNSYQGIQMTGGSKAIVSTVAGTPLLTGITMDQIYDIPHAEDIRFSPDIWPAAGVTNAPGAGGPHAAWMRANGQGMVLIRVDGLIAMDTYISGYNIGIMCTNTGNGDPGATFYMGAVSNCATALLAQNMPGALGLMFAAFTLDGDTAVNRTRTDSDANVQFNRCQIVGHNGPAVSSTGTGWHSWMQFQNCTISNALQLNAGVFNAVNCTLLGATQCVMSAGATRAAFTGCTFSPVKSIVNAGNPGSLLIDSRGASSNAMPIIYWTNIVNDYLSRRPAKTDLFVATNAPWGATGNGSTDDTASIQSALNAAGANGGGIVFLPGGKYRLTSTLDVPQGVELRGPYELRHRTWPGPDGKAKGAVLQPYGGQGSTTGPAAIALEANSGLVGVTISYESQSSNCFAFPPAIQGRGGNVYVIGVVCPNPYYYVDLDTYTCTNHFLYLVDGWALLTGYKVGHGSSGSIVDCQGNWTYWIDNYDSQSSLPGSVQAPVQNFVAHNMQSYVLGDCTELLVKDFNIIENTFLMAKDQGGKGPNATLIGDYCDATVQGIVLDAAGPCMINAVNTPMCVFNFGSYSDLATTLVGVLSTTNFQGTARFFNTILFAGPYWDFNINGGDVGLEVVHMDNANMDSAVNGGVFRLVNNSSRNTGGNSSPYNVTFASGAGLAGKTNEFIGCYNYYGYTCTNVNATNPVNVWGNFGLAPAPVVSGLTATPGGSQVTVSWMAATNVTSYNVKRASSSSGPFVLLANTSATNYLDTDVVSNATYYYVVSTLSALGEGPDSAVVSSRDVLLSRSGWVVSASVGGSPGNAIDGNLSTRWSTDTLQTNGQWFQVDMLSAKTIFKIVLDTTPSPNDYPRGYQVTLSNDGSNWGSPVATGAGNSAVTTITFAPQTARYLRITQTGTASGNYWSIHELYIYGTPPTTPDPLVAVPGTNQVALSWFIPQSATSYNVKRATNPAGPYTIIATPTSSRWTVSNALIGRYLYYVVSALNSVGESGDSTPVCAAAVPQTVTLQPAVQGGSFAVVATVLQGQTCVLETRTNLTLGGWTAVTTNTAVANGPLTLTDQSGGTNKCRFYRLRYQ
ncbi:MAG TPA: discoidin domain-containing protein [Candidatus Binatia bacterium]|nr:discoidin domain-containing protein [Candidatus Binatia bacterium]